MNKVLRPGSKPYVSIAGRVRQHFKHNLGADVSDLARLIELEEDCILCFNHGMEEAAMEAIYDLAIKHYEEFKRNFQIADDFDFHMSDEFYSDDHLRRVEILENNLYSLAQKIRNRRLDVLNNRTKRSDTIEGEGNL